MSGSLVISTPHTLFCLKASIVSDELEDEETELDLDGLEQEEDDNMGDQDLPEDEGADEDGLDQDDLSEDDPNDDGMGIFRKALDQSAQQPHPSSTQ